MANRLGLGKDEWYGLSNVLGRYWSVLLERFESHNHRLDLVPGEIILFQQSGLFFSPALFIRLQNSHISLQIGTELNKFVNFRFQFVDFQCI
tara:strand:- start:6452 stop:6727 length:276 start_codon:yes stop_codon:yes gene_type:complete